MHAANVQGFKAQEVASMLWAVAEMSWDWAEAFDSLCSGTLFSSIRISTAARGMHAAKVQGFKAHEVASMLWAVAEMSWVWPEAFDSLCGAAAAKVQDFNGMSWV